MSREIRVHTSNRTEALAAALSDLVATPAGGPFDAETIVVQGRGMAVWLSHTLAKAHGVAANFDFVYPRDLVARALSSVLGADAGAETALGPDELVFAVLAALPGLLSRPEFSSLAHYLRDDRSGVRAYQLARRIALQFDQYVLYRPELVRAWERNESGGVPAAQAWQPVLFRALRNEAHPRHVAALEDSFVEALRDGAIPAGLPKRIALFGISTLPPLFVRILAHLSPHAETRLFLFSASPAAWSKKQLSLFGDAPVESPLVPSLGALSSEFRHVLETEARRADVKLVLEDLHAEPKSPGALGTVQRELFLGPPRKETRAVLDPSATTLGIHSCHGPMREVEVLHDQLLALLTRKDSTLAPENVVVMMPDVDGYAPFVEAVFDRAPKALQIPYRISDRSVRVDAPAIEAFLRILGLVNERLVASQVLDLLNLSAVALRFGIDPSDVDQLTEWVVESGVRWGVDADHRKKNQQPGDAQNTWRFGLDRLLLGYAMNTEGRATFEGVLPFDEVEGKRAALVGKLAELATTLFSELDSLETARPLADWRPALARTLAALVHADRATAWQHVKIQEALASLEADAARAGFSGTLDLSVVRDLLSFRLDVTHAERGFLTRGVTFCAMVPMRTIPFDVVCLLGMNDGVFPRASRSPDFDLLRQGPPEPGDRDRRKDDRHLFLEALLAARRRLLIFYTGQSIQDGSAIPPSVVVSELVDRVAARFDPPVPFSSETDRRAKVAEALVVRHPLQGFSRRYFDGSDPRLFSYAETYKLGAEHLGPDRVDAPRLFTALLPDAAPTGDVIALDDLVRFFEDPIAALLRARLGLHLREDETEIPDREPLEPSPLERYRIGDELLRLGLGEERALPLLRAQGILPPAELGTVTFEDAKEDVDRIRELVEDALVGERRSLAVDAVLPSGVRVVGRVSDCHDHGPVRFAFSLVRAKHQLAMFVRLLGLAATPGSPPGLQAALAGRGRASGRGPSVVGFRLTTPKNAAAILDDLVRIYREGLRGPLRFTAESGLAYAEGLSKGADSALERARIRHQAARDAGNGPHVARVFGDSLPDFSDVPAAVGDFRQIVAAVCVPLVQARRDLP
ncbi:MAG TPA: exodeoxyribonuclease V subunit gamma [Polyangiaceae bacterium]|nr:exodeoxyribonuclease V subunit gamma [Polyangiaceae bacterium]